MIDNRKLKEMLAQLAADDRELGEELRERLDQPLNEALVTEGPDGAPALTPETIVLRSGRPVLAIRENAVVPEFRDAGDSDVWKKRIIQAGSKIAAPIRAVGRIDLIGHADFSWVGTGWLVRPTIIATNRHVAQLFARRSGQGFQFRPGTLGGPVAASIDFLREMGRDQKLAFQITDVLHIEDEEEADMAFLRVAGPPQAAPIALARGKGKAKQQVAVIGYPARDSRIPDQDLMQRLYGDVYDCKRFAPGQLKRVEETTLQHDATTLGGNSGSVVLDLETGQALGIHFAGRFLEANFAVPAALIEARVQLLEGGGARSRPAPVREMDSSSTTDSSASDSGADNSSTDSGSTAQLPGTVQRLECTIPLKITLEIGVPVLACGVTVAAVAAPVAPPPLTAATATAPRLGATSAAGQGEQDEDDAEFAPEAPVSDYLDRKGYAEDFLGAGTSVPLPQIRRDAAQIVTFDFDGNEEESVLRYLHFSVVMHRTRRQCFYSAVNINGGQSRKTRRPGWAFDPRIPRELQIMKECYGNAPKFSRGHMTRREDPAWGSSTAVAQKGNADSMHVTNAVPQMQSFNAGIWLQLEDYALENARQDDMKISVFTGPVFKRDDPTQFGVKIPRQFWKVIAFIHDETGELSATGYSLSQESFLSEDEFVFGAHETHQRSLRWIEQQAGVSFGELTALDLFEDREGFAQPLSSLRQIRFR
jgi:endonuclease G, mitochondrial